MARKVYITYLALSAITQWGIAFHFATYVLFLTSKGLTIFDASLVNTAYAVTLIVAEFPTGVIADTWGRKYSFIVSCFLVSIGLFIYSISSEFIWFLVAEIIAAIGATCSTGAFDAWVIDSIHFYKSPINVSTVFMRAGQIRKISSVVGVLLGSYSAEYFDLSFPWLAAAVIYFFVGIISFFVMREDYPIRKSSGNKIRDYFETARRSVEASVTNKQIVYSFVVILFFTMSMQAYNMQWQPYFGQYFTSPSLLGWFFVGIIISSLFGISFAKKIIREKHNSLSPILIIMFMIGAVMILTSISPMLSVSIFTFMIHEGGRGLFGVLSDSYINEHIQSSERASVLSLQAFVGHIGMFIGLPTSGWIALHYSISVSWIIFSLFLMLSSLLVLMSQRRRPSIRAD